MDKIFALINLFRKGNEVADVEKWKKRQIDANYLAGFLLALFGVFKVLGVELPITDEAALTIAGGILAAVNVGLTAVTSKRAGLLPAKPDAPVAEPEPVPASTADAYDKPSPGHPEGP